jgi:hypothetical protein
MILTFDIDGVVAEHVPEELMTGWRSYTNYRNKGPHPTLDTNILNDLIRRHYVYFISARSFPGALDCTRRWLCDMDIDLDMVCGVICAEGTGKSPGEGSERKASIIKYIGSALHVDDHPLVISMLDKNKGCLFLNEAYPPNVELYNNSINKCWIANSWQQINQVVKEKERIDQQ